MMVVGLMGSWLAGWLTGIVFRMFVNLIGGNIE